MGFETPIFRLLFFWGSTHITIVAIMFKCIIIVNNVSNFFSIIFPYSLKHNLKKLMLNITPVPGCIIIYMIYLYSVIRMETDSVIWLVLRWWCPQFLHVTYIHHSAYQKHHMWSQCGCVHPHEWLPTHNMRSSIRCPLKNWNQEL